MHPQTINAFDLPGYLFSEAEPTLIVGQEQHVAATAGSRGQAGVWR
jgi:hypothetical protein